MSLFPIAGALAGHLLSSGDRKRQKALEDQAYAEFGRVDLPTLQELEARLIATGEWDSLPSDFGNRSARDEAIARMMEVARTGGMDPQSRLAMEEARLAGAAEAARGRASVRQEAARRGMGGAGEILGQLYAQQAGAQAASLEGMRAAAASRERALRAIESGGSMASSAEAQDFNRAARIAAEKDAIARFNAEMDWRTQMANNARLQQGFNNALDLARARSGAALTRAGQYGRDAQSTADMWAGVGQGVQDTLTGAGQMIAGMPPSQGGFSMGGGRGGFGGGGAPPTTPAPSPFSGSTARGSFGTTRRPPNPYDWGY